MATTWPNWVGPPIGSTNSVDGCSTDSRTWRGGTGADITVIFDGATVVGAHADRRRMVRVRYSPDGVTADDVIRDEVRRLPPTRSIVVVTDDAEIVARRARPRRQRRAQQRAPRRTDRADDAG